MNKAMLLSNIEYSSERITYSRMTTGDWVKCFVQTKCIRACLDLNLRPQNVNRSANPTQSLNEDDRQIPNTHKNSKLV